MFPQRAVPDTSEDDFAKKPENPADESFASRHSGKIGLTAFAVAVGLIYSYFKGNSNEREKEKEVANAQAIDPAEINEVRFLSRGMALDRYIAVVETSARFFPTGSTTYRAFVEHVIRAAAADGGGIAHGHLLDRIVYKHLARGHPATHNAGSSTGSGSSGSSSSGPGTAGGTSTSILLPVPFLLTVLNIVLQATPTQRAETLFLVAREVDAQRGSSLQEDDRGEVTLSAATEVVRHLADSCQVTASPCFAGMPLTLPL